MSKISYAARWGQKRRRTVKGHPRIVARRERAYARGASLPGDQPNPSGSKTHRKLAERSRG